MSEHYSLIVESFRQALRVVRWLWPGWWFYVWLCSRWPGHDCKRQPITCWLEWCFSLPNWVWIDV